MSESLRKLEQKEIFIISQLIAIGMSFVFNGVSNNTNMLAVSLIKAVPEPQETLDATNKFANIINKFVIDKSQISTMPLFDKEKKEDLEHGILKFPPRNNQ